MFRSRYHSQFPITCKDPITNQIIVGEVEFFYWIKGNPNLEFFGTDFNYAHSKLFRERFDSMTPEKELLEVGLRSENNSNNGGNDNF